MGIKRVSKKVLKEELFQEQIVHGDIIIAPPRNRRSPIRDERKYLKDLSVLPLGTVINVKGIWGLASCELVERSFGHYIFQSIIGKWKISFTEFELEKRLCTEWIPNITNSLAYARRVGG